ncbi:MAG: iron-sulfur cluster assembly scaffold protein [Acidobacteria bacterium]|nr:iron-sulfur cluster assembly scaffold protein [Acidobacteriota bacterium]MBI3425899.1 iron-sulfur cluster assembly scaffold protein [Acidobacteriota bacterium]
MYSPQILKHLDNPHNVGELADASVRGMATNPVCGDLLHLYLKIEDARIGASGFQVQGCPPCIAAASVLTEMLNGKTLAEARQLNAKDVSAALGGLPRNKEHCAVLAMDALRAALAEMD